MEKQKYSKGCLMVSYDIPEWKQYVDNYIDDDDIYDNELNEFGIEYEPHCTIVYGFDPEIKFKQLKSFLLPTHKIKTRFQAIDLFENEEFDVLKFNLVSAQLSFINAMIRQQYNIETQYPEYNPHMTIAYLKPGTGYKYAKQLNKPFFLMPSNYFYSYPDGQKEFLEI